MPASRVNVTPFNGPSSEPNANTARYSFTLTNGSGNDRLVVVISNRVSAAVQTATSATFNSASGIVWQNAGFDGGNSSNTAISYFTEAQLPATAGTYDVEIGWDNSGLRSPAIIFELRDVDQSLLLENFDFNTLEDTVEGPATALGATLAGSAGKMVFSYLAAAEFATLDETFPTQPLGMTLYSSANQSGNAPLSLAYIDSAASASEVYDWTVDYNAGGTVVDAIISGVFAVNDAASGGVSVTVPSASLGITTYAPTVSAGSATAPVISNVTPNRATELTTATVDQYNTVSNFTYNSVSLTSITEATPTTVTGIMPKGGQAFGSSNDFVITDSVGASNAFSAVFNPPAGYTFVTLTSEPSRWPGLVSGDQLAYEQLTTPGGFTVSIASDGTITYQSGTPDGESFDAYSLDQSDGYSASTTATFVKGAGNVSIEVPSASLGITTYAPTVTAGGNVSIEVPSASLGITTFAPTVNAGGSISIEVPSASLGITTYAPTVTAGGNVSVEVPSASLGITTYAPTVTAGGSVSVEVPSASLQISTYAPSVSVGPASIYYAKESRLVRIVAPDNVVSG